MPQLLYLDGPKKNDDLVEVMLNNYEPGDSSKPYTVHTPVVYSR